MKGIRSDALREEVHGRLTGRLRWPAIRSRSWQVSSASRFPAFVLLVAIAKFGRYIILAAATTGLT
ncbi:hypothetical protein N2599_22525 (plasmid) [Rhizobium sullae]|uniref:Uncharacterized protein n=1 Tax=Rhizobium sullae TaxID=50338 RepID=A0ABY5XUS6_RHISU|nr:hypothetical protein [Rhizobium sullae]UWU18067.1 hypothetical protein N2599_22525 [Rhizobium sullae]